MNAPLSLTKPRQARLTIEDFLVLDRTGAFDSYSKSELIDGTIYVVNAQFSRHMKAKVRLLLRLAAACERLGTGLEVWSEGSVAFAPASMPEPDLFITTRTPASGNAQSDRIPVSADDVALIVEIAQTTLAFDLGKKAMAYAKGGLAEYWVVDLSGGRIHRHWNPTSKGFAERDEFELGAVARSVTIPQLAIATDGLD